MLIHVDRGEDWTPPSPRSLHSAQSGLPSSDSDADDRPRFTVIPATWTMEVEDGQRGDRLHRLGRAPVADLGCRGMPRGGRDHDDAGGAGGVGRRTWKDALLRRGRTPTQPPPAPAPRHRSRSPPARRHNKSTHSRRAGGRRLSAGEAHQHHRRPSAPRSPRRASGSGAAEGDGGNNKGKDPVDDFFRQAKRPILASVIIDNSAADVQAAADDVVAAPLDFDNDKQKADAVMEAQLDTLSPTLATTPRPPGSSTAPRRLFTEAPAPIIANAPLRRPSAPPKACVPVAPTRHSARQATNTSKTPVSQRASLRIVKELGLLGPKEKMTKEVAGALIRRFDEPLTNNDIAVIAKLTRLDKDSLLVAASLAGPEGAAAAASV
ncbi:hypothetical protein VPH35_071391 [Triticum aestivum]